MLEKRQWPGESPCACLIDGCSYVTDLVLTDSQKLALRKMRLGGAQSSRTEALAMLDPAQRMKHQVLESLLEAANQALELSLMNFAYEGGLCH